MSLCLVRCPYCAKRFNISGILPGTRLRCGHCTAVLIVPSGPAVTARFRVTRSVLLQSVVGVAAGLGLAFGLWLLLRPASEPGAVASIGKPARAAILAAPAEEAAPAGPESRFVDDPVGRAKQDVFREFGPGFIWETNVRPYLVALERSERFIADDLIQEYALRLETLHQAFRREFAESLALEPVEGVLAVVILNSRESFDRYCEARDKKRMASAIKGIYEYGRRRVLTYHDFNAPYEVLLHEGAHQLVHHHTLRRVQGRKVPSTYWFQEGVGTYFEGFRRRLDGEILQDPGTNGLRLPALKQVLLQKDRRDFIPLTVLVGMSVDDFWEWFERASLSESSEVTRKAQLYYAESWAFVHFLRQSGPETRRVFDAYFQSELAGEGSKSVFEELVWKELGLDLPQLEDLFVKYIEGLR